LQGKYQTRGPANFKCLQQEYPTRVENEYYDPFWRTLKKNKK